MPPSIALLFFASGAVAVGFEALWAAELARLLGGTTSSTAFVVGTFMAGMGLGYLWGGRFSTSARRPLLAYGLAEIGLAASALFAVRVVPSLEGQLSAPAAYAVSATLLATPTVLAGFTLPVLVEGTRGTVGDALGTLYAVNTAGAVAGVLVTGLLALGALGVAATGAWLAAVGASVGLTAVALGLRAPLRSLPPAHAAPVRAPSEWLGVALLTGLASLAEEVLWTRSLAVHFNSSTYAFSIILAVFLLGLALGAAICAALLRKGISPRALLVGSQVGAAFFVLLSPELLLLSESAIPGYVGVSRIADAASWWQTLGIGALRTSVVLLPPTTLLGFALPLIAELRAGGDAMRRGRLAGLVVSASTVGGVVGSLGARFVMLPYLGIEGGLRAAAIVHAAAATGAILARGEPLRPAAPRSRWLAVPALLALAVLLRPGGEPFVGRLPEWHTLLLVDEGVQDTTAVVEDMAGYRHIFSNGIAYAGDSPTGLRYMRLLGHVPSLHARERRRALVVCVGTGTTAASVARHPFERIDVVDISPAVDRTLPFFTRVNDRFFEDPRVHLHIDDGRIFTARAAAGSYDVVTLEPPPPRAAGVAALYSVEFYRHARRILRDGGAFAQWLPLHGMTRRELSLLTRTFFEVFPEGQIVWLHPMEAALLATRGTGADRDEIARRATDPRVSSHLEEIGVEDPGALPVATAADASRVTGPGPVVTDDHPRIEHFGALLGPDTDAREDALLGAGEDFARALFR
jgi:spermidine synthase